MVGAVVVSGAAATHISRTHPQLVRQYGAFQWMDPGEPEVRRHSRDVILDGEDVIELAIETTAPCTESIRRPDELDGDSHDGREKYDARRTQELKERGFRVVRLDNRDNPQVPPGKPQRELDFCYFGGLYRNVRLEARLIDDLLDLTRIARGRLQLQLQRTDGSRAADEGRTVRVPGAVDRGGQAGGTGPDDERSHAPAPSRHRLIAIF